MGSTADVVDGGGLRKPEMIPQEPGVYRFYRADEVIYVGKAVNLKARLANYFSSGIGVKTAKMVSVATKVDWTVVGSEVAALVLEHKLINEYNPIYNVKFKDDKSYPYLGVSIKDEVPKLFISRGKQSSRSVYFGPVPNAGAVRDSFDGVLKLFPVRSCTEGVYLRAKRSGRACLLADIGKCSAPCVGRISIAEHKELANRMVKFLKAPGAAANNSLKDEMVLAARNLEFERAGRLRDEVAGMATVLEGSRALWPTTLFGDFLALYKEAGFVFGSCLSISGGLIKSSFSKVIEHTLESDEEEMMGDFITSLYAGVEGSNVPALIVVDQDFVGHESVALFLSQVRGRAVKIHVAKSGVKREVLDVVAKNARSALISWAAKRSSDPASISSGLTELAQAIGMEQIPLRIECFDLSHISGTNVVASMVVFEDGVAKKSEWRRFIIDTGESYDDTKGMYQVLMRRLKYLSSEPEIGNTLKFSYKPSLIIVDGGKPQVSAAVRAFKDSGVEGVAFCGLAKRLEELWLPGDPDPVILGRSSEAMYLVQRIRDEAHRFAIGFHKSRRGKAALAGVLDGCSGVNKNSKARIMERFISLQALREAEVEQLCEIKGVSLKIATAIKAYVANIGFAVDTASGEVLK